MARRGTTIGLALRTEATPEEQEIGIVDAATAEFADVGVRRANMDLIARRAGVSRSTLYRRFPNKEQLLAAVMNKSSDEFGARVRGRISGLPANRVVTEALRMGVRELDRDPLVNRLLRDDSDMAGTVFGFVGAEMQSILDAVCVEVAKELRTGGATMSDADLRVASELLVRLIASLLHSDSRVIDLSTDAAIDRLGETFLAKLVW